MSEHAEETTTEVTETPAVETPTESAPPAPPSWSGPSEHEWKAVVGGLGYLQKQGYFDPEEEEEPDYSEMDTAQLVQRYVQQEIGKVKPYVETAARESGEKRLNELLDDFEQRPEVGKLDKSTRKAVGFVAESMLGRINPEGNDPQAATYAVYEAAKMLGGLTKSQREEAVNEFKASFKKNPYTDPDYAGSATRSREPAKSYDEVINRYTGDEEV